MKKTVLYFQSSLNESNNAELAGVCRFAKMAGWCIRVTSYAAAARACGGSADEAARPDVKGLLAFWAPDGVIVECGAAGGLLDPLDFKPVPTVFLDCDPSEQETCVTFGAKPIAALAARELLSLGFRTYAYIPWKTRTSWSVARGEEFARLVKMNGCKFHEFRKRPFGDDAETYRSWLRAWLRNAPKPMGVFAVNDYMASDVLSCAERERIDVPNELAVIGVDNDVRTCEQTTPTLTSIQLDCERGGYLAAELLELKMAHPERKVDGAVVDSAYVFHRQSTFVYSRRDDRVSVALKRIRRNACDGLTAKEVIAGMGCSRRLAELRFREVTGHSILEEIIAVRVARAQHFLAHSPRSVAAVAQACGYRSTEALGKVFRAATGLTPRAWRQKMA